MTELSTLSAPIKAWSSTPIDYLYTMCLRPLLPLLALATLLSSATAQSSVWKVSKGDQAIYVGGTCHILRAQDYPLPQEFELAYERSDKLVFEVDPAIANDPAFAMKVMQRAIFTDGSTLESVLSEEAYTALAEASQRVGMPIAIIKTMKPGLAVMVVSVQEMTNRGISQEGVEVYFGKRAESDGKSIGQLENADFQLDMLLNLGAGYESDFVLLCLKDLEDIDSMISEMIAAWRTGDMSAMDSLFNDTFTEFPELRDQILVSRNRNWIPKIKAMFETPEVEYVLVGAGHTAGDDGILAMLVKEGYQIEQVVAK